MEYAKGGTLAQKIFTGHRLSEDEARSYFQQLIVGVSYCHDKGISHRDLKPSNILLCDGNHLKICDFGLSKSSSTPRSLVGTPSYMAPEVFAKRRYDGKSADVWSCGGILYAMLTTDDAFPDSGVLRNEEITSKRIEEALDLIPAYVSQQCKDLLRRIFVINPQERITIEEISNNQWFSKDLPQEPEEAGFWGGGNTSFQSEEEIKRIIKEAKSGVSAIVNIEEYNTSC